MPLHSGSILKIIIYLLLLTGASVALSHRSYSLSCQEHQIIKKLFLTAFSADLIRNKAMIVKSALLALSVLAIIGSCVDCVDKYNGYKQLNKHLTKNKVPRDTRAYFLAAKEELERLNSKAFSMSFDLRAAIEEILKLESIFEAPECSLDEYYQLKHTDNRSNGHRFVSDDEIKQQLLSPIDFIVHEVSLKRAQKCKDVWPMKFIEAQAKLSGQLIVGRLYDYKAKSFAELRKQLNDDREFAKHLLDYKFLEDRVKIRDAYLHVVRHSADDPERCRFYTMFDKYLRFPCDRFYETIDLPILTQAKYDSEMFSNGPAHEAFEPLDTSNLIPFYQAIAIGEACSDSDKSWFIDQVYDYWYQVQKKRNDACINEIRIEDQFMQAHFKS